MKLLILSVVVGLLVLSFLVGFTVLRHLEGPLEQHRSYLLIDV